MRKQMDVKFLRECLDRADAYASVQAQTITAMQETIRQYRINLELLHAEIGRLEQMIGIVQEAP
jgi:hypothetical protein